MVVQDQPTWFQTPSGYIGRVMGAGDGARCDILRWTYTPPPRPADCPLDWGYALEVRLGARAMFACASDTVGNAPDVPPYGHAAAIDGITCTSQETGVRCETDDRHGFALSAENYELF